MSRDILENIIEDFNPDKFIRFFREKNRIFAPRKEELNQYNDEIFKNCQKLGEIDFSGSEQMIVCAFEATKSLSERSGKKAQYEKGKKILKEQQADSGIFIFCDKKGDFRFSLIYANYLGKRRDWSAFRRFTYFVSQEFTNKTFLQRIGNADFSNLEKIKDAFSVEKVTDEFFNRFHGIFEDTKAEFIRANKAVCLRLKERYEDREYGEQINKCAFTFLGRIIFLYFLQRKGWIEDKTNFLKEILENNDNHGFYVNFLKPLFFEVFAKKEDERPSEIKAKFKNTPYLNGGLFEKSTLEEEFIAIFFDDKFIKKVILDFFENYNFTVDENTPDDQEVSIDPEMLGKVFENTLAEEERGQKGTFYTPREIVHFMVKESLWQFLINETKFSEEKLRKFVFDYDIAGFSKEEIRFIDNLLENIKVLDPAVGSAAFPVEMMQILVRLRTALDVKVGRNISEVELKKRFIKNNLYGVDIDAGAIEIAKLRLWLSLVVDYNKSEAEPLPNLDFQFRLGNSLQEKIGDIDIFNTGFSDELALGWQSGAEKTMQEMLKIKDEFYSCDNDIKKKKLKKQFDEKEHSIILEKIKDLEKQYRSRAKTGALQTKEAQKIAKTLDNLRQKVKDGTYKLFKPDFHFSEVFDRKDKKGNQVKGFDIVIGNPPYGVKVEDDIKEGHSLGSKDSYGVFISTALKRFLKTKGILCFIVSDTWLTIKTHKELREQVLAKQLHKVVRMHQDCFDATVNACVITITNSNDENKELIAADLTNISTRENITELREKLYSLDKFIGQSTPIFAVYKYKQGLIKTNSNLPIFVGSPKLFNLFNSFTLHLLDLAQPEQGIGTGDNAYYLRKDEVSRGSYDLIDVKKILRESDISSFNNGEKLNGVEPEDYHGRHFLPYDKGGESDTGSNWLPQYHVETGYYIDWSKKSVKRLFNATIEECKKRRKKEENSTEDIRPEDSSIRAAWLPEPENWFKKGITFSRTGQYAPTFRIKCKGPFDNKSDAIIIENVNYLLGVLNSKLIRFFSKTFLCHTVQFEKDFVAAIPISNNDSLKDVIEVLVTSIIEKQKKNPRYGYMGNEQKEIDKLVYETYGLNEDDIREIETWYARRYPKLARSANIN